MAISYSERKTAVRRLFPYERLAVAIALSLSYGAAYCQGQSLYSSIVEANASGMSGYVFVSGSMPDSSLIALARDARAVGMSLVLNGYIQDGPNGLEATKRRIAAINSACCANAGAHWQINPLLFQRYDIKAVPAFVIARGTGNGPADFSKITGEMSVPNALKFFGQTSKLPEVKSKANSIYVKAFSTQ